MFSQRRREKQMKPINVIDSCMGTGKTTYAINMMNNSPSYKRFIYVTPFIDEVKRVKASVTNRDFKSPDNNNKDRRKMTSLKKLVAEGADIVTTHALFGDADNELLDLLMGENYTLIIDEVMDVIEQVELSRDDYKILLDDGLIVKNDGGLIRWTGSIDYNGRFNNVKYLAQEGNLWSVNDAFFVWNFPVKIFRVFQETFLLTYMFKGQIQKYYYDFHGVEYNYFSVENSDPIPYTENYEQRAKFKELINIYDGRLNNLGEEKTSLSKNWFQQHSARYPVLKKHLRNYLRNIVKAKSNDILWTTYKPFQSKLSGDGYAKAFICWNTRATNDYKDRHNLAFCINRFMNPYEERFFTDRGIAVNQELLALTDLLQWIFRSAIRVGEPINLYLPSKRMRTLLEKWLNAEL
jgi:hypothetical protein